MKSNVSVNVTKFLDVNRTKINNWYIYIYIIRRGKLPRWERDSRVCQQISNPLSRRRRRWRPLESTCPRSKRSMERLLLAFRSSPRLFLPRSSREYLYNILLFFHNFQISHFYRRIYKIKNLITWKILTSKQVLRKTEHPRISGGWISVEPASQLRLKIASSLSLSPPPPPSPAVLLKKGRVYEIARASRRPSSLLCVVFH